MFDPLEARAIEVHKDIVVISSRILYQVCLFLHCKVERRKFGVSSPYCKVWSMLIRTDNTAVILESIAALTIRSCIQTRQAWRAAYNTDIVGWEAHRNFDVGLVVFTNYEDLVGSLNLGFRKYEVSQVTATNGKQHEAAIEMPIVWATRSECSQAKPHIILKFITTAGPRWRRAWEAVQSCKKKERGRNGLLRGRLPIRCA